MLKKKLHERIIEKKGFSLNDWFMWGRVGGCFSEQLFDTNHLPLTYAPHSTHNNKRRWKKKKKVCP
jgi:hypothetical protein